MIIISVCLVVLEIISNALRVTTNFSVVTEINAAVDAITSFCIAIFFIYNGVRVLLQLRKLRDLSSTSSNAATRKVRALNIT